MTPQRRAYILDHLAKVTPNDNWLRISEKEFSEFGGHEFFQGCMVEYMRDEKYFTTRVGQRGWDKAERIQLPWKIHAPAGGGWMPPRPFNSNNNFVVTSNAAYFESNCTPTNETENTMEHHVNREQLIQVLDAHQGEYEELYARFKEHYNDVASARLLAYIEGDLPHSAAVLPCDDQGVIEVPKNLTNQYLDLRHILSLDVREVIELTDSEFSTFAEHDHDNRKALEAAIERLERLA